MEKRHVFMILTLSSGKHGNLRYRFILGLQCVPRRIDVFHCPFSFKLPTNTHDK